MENDEIQLIEKKKRSLKRYKKNRACIERLNFKLVQYDEKMTSVKSPNFSGMPRGGTPITIADQISDKIELEERIKRLTEKGQVLRAEILEELDTLDDPKEVEVLELFFIDCLEIPEIADVVGFTERHIYRLYSQGVTKLALSEKDQ